MKDKMIGIVVMLIAGFLVVTIGINWFTGMQRDVQTDVAAQVNTVINGLSPHTVVE